MSHDTTPGDESPPRGAAELVRDAELSPMDPESVPPSYPRDLEGWVPVADGHRIWIRPVLPEDVARIANAFAHADIETIRRRFFTAAPPTDRAHLEYLANVDYRTRLALVAMDADGNSVGIGRFEATSETAAEVAIVVAPTWRRRGVGAALLSALEAPAAQRGITRLVALYLPENMGVERLLMSIGYGGRRIVDGIAQLTKDLAPTAPASTAVDSRNG